MVLIPHSKGFSFHWQILHLLDEIEIGDFQQEVACALVMAGEDLEKHTAVKDILIQIDVYFQVQLPYHSRSSFRDEAAEAGTTTATERTGTRTETTSLETTTSMDDSST
uniref:Uncharacterized protein n=1 Tax=Cucumis sativus TaxID=3659 RepID=A0A0A0KPI3_CUCSA